MNKKIGIFDSGYGGLVVLDSVKKKLPQYSYVYLGDNLRAPYGDLSDKLIYEHTCRAVEFLFNKNCEIVIVACNTVSAKALRKLQKHKVPIDSPKRVLGVVVPLLEEVGNSLKNTNKHICVLGTRATIRSGAYQREIKKLHPKIQLHSRSCPLLVPLVESGDILSEQTNKALHQYTKNLFNKKISLLILGCTHFHYLERQISKIFGPKTKTIKTPVVVALKFKAYLKSHKDLEKRLIRSEGLEIYTTGDEKKFKKFYKKYFGKTKKIMKASIN